MLLLLLLRLLGYLPVSAAVASTTPAAQYRPDNTEEEKYSDDPQTPCEDRVSPPPAWLRWLFLRRLPWGRWAPAASLQRLSSHNTPIAPNNAATKSRTEKQEQQKE